jgi:ArsR family transcriptional regulator
MDNLENAELLKILGHPVRLEILRCLMKGPSCATMTNKRVPISQPNMSQHLKALTDLRIIDYCRVGTRKCFYICRPDFVKGLFSLLDGEHPHITLSTEEISKAMRISHDQ